MHGTVYLDFIYHKKEKRVFSRSFLLAFLGGPLGKPRMGECDLLPSSPTSLLLSNKQDTKATLFIKPTNRKHFIAIIVVCAQFCTLNFVFAPSFPSIPPLPSTPAAAAAAAAGIANGAQHAAFLSALSPPPNA
jgi:hypothetical protein